MKSILVLSLLLDVAGSGSIVAQSPGTFTATGDMSTGRMGHTATLLPNGKVLIAGGFNTADSGFPARATAELYDPATGTFTSTGNMTTARSGHTGTLLPNGKVLIAGGKHPLLFSAELYDASTGTFTATGEMTTALGGFTATLLNNGKVLITSGPSAQVYDPAMGLFAATGSYAGRSAESVYTATLLPDGRVLLGLVGQL